MNDHFYHSHIKQYIDIPNRKIINKQDTWLIGEYRLKHEPYKLLLANMVVHTGSPCYRYCTCHFYSNDDKISYYKSIRADS